MLLEDFDFSRLEAVKLCCVEIKDNKAVRHWKELYPLETVTGEDKLKGFYLGIRELSNGVIYTLWNDCKRVLAVTYGNLMEDEEVESLKDLLAGILPFKGFEGFKKYLSDRERRGLFVNVAQIEAMERLGEPELANHYAQYRQDYLDRRAALQEDERRQEEIEQQKRNEEKQKAMEAQIEDAEKCVKEGRMLKNAVLDDGRSIVLALLKKHEISVPLKTQGWINQKLATVRYDQDGEPLVQFYRSKGCKCSESVFRYLRLLKQAVDMKSERALA